MHNHLHSLSSGRHQTVALIAAVAAVTLLMLLLEVTGVFSLSLQSNSIYNPMPSYGAMPAVRTAEPWRSSSEIMPHHFAAPAASSSSHPWWAAQAESKTAHSVHTATSSNGLEARHQRLEQRRQLRSEQW